MNRSDLLLKKRNAPEKRQKRGCCGSTELPIVVATRSWREISCGKLGTLIQQTKNSLNFVSTCLKVVDTRRDAVGTIIADRPPHKTVRACLRIRLPPWMSRLGFDEACPKTPSFLTPQVADSTHSIFVSFALPKSDDFGASFSGWLNDRCIGGHQ